MVALGIFVAILVVCSIASGRYIRGRAEEMTDAKQQRIEASERRAAGHIWLLGSILAAVFGAGMVVQLQHSIFGTETGLVELGILVICVLMAIRCGSQALFAYQHARSIKRRPPTRPNDMPFGFAELDQLVDDHNVSALDEALDYPEVQRSKSLRGRIKS